MRKITQLTQNLKIAFKNYEFEVSEWISTLENISLNSLDNDTLDDCLYTAISQYCENKFIYYQDSDKFLCEHDSGFFDSFALAADYGYSCKNLNSTVLAYLYLKEKLTEQLPDLITQILELIANEQGA